VADRKPFLLRIDREVLEAVQRWADDDLRSLNGQIEFLLRKAIREARRGGSPEQRHDGSPGERRNAPTEGRDKRSTER
jgi:hypothetical protein